MFLPLKHFYHIFLSGEAPQGHIKLKAWVLKFQFGTTTNKICVCDVHSNFATFFKENIWYIRVNLHVGHYISRIDFLINQMSSPYFVRGKNGTRLDITGQVHTHKVCTTDLHIMHEVDIFLSSSVKDNQPDADPEDRSYFGVITVL